MDTSVEMDQQGHNYCLCSALTPYSTKNINLFAFGRLNIEVEYCKQLNILELMFLIG